MYVRPSFRLATLATASASCAPQPGTIEWCEANGGIWAKIGGGDFVCFVPPDKVDPQSLVDSWLCFSQSESITIGGC